MRSSRSQRGLRLSSPLTASLTFSFVDFIGAKASLELGFLHNDVVAAERVLWRADTPRQIRMLVEGSTFATPGTYTAKTFRADLAGVYSNFTGGKDEDEGSNVAKATFECGYELDGCFVRQFPSRQ